MKRSRKGSAASLSTLLGGSVLQGCCTDLICWSHVSAELEVIAPLATRLTRAARRAGPLHAGRPGWPSSRLLWAWRHQRGSTSIRPHASSVGVLALSCYLAAAVRSDGRSVGCSYDMKYAPLRGSDRPEQIVVNALKRTVFRVSNGS
jgi:hypothetical protein